jgi:hypothetical protein
MGGRLIAARNVDLHDNAGRTELFGKSLNNRTVRLGFKPNGR